MSPSQNTLDNRSRSLAPDIANKNSSIVHDMTNSRSVTQFTITLKKGERLQNKSGPRQMMMNQSYQSPYESRPLTKQDARNQLEAVKYINRKNYKGFGGKLAKGLNHTKYESK